MSAENLDFRGFVHYDAKQIRGMLVKDLRNLLQENGLCTEGKKSVLVKRLIDFFGQNDTREHLREPQNDRSENIEAQNAAAVNLEYSNSVMHSSMHSLQFQRNN